MFFQIINMNAILILQKTLIKNWIHLIIKWKLKLDRRTPIGNERFMIGFSADHNLFELYSIFKSESRFLFI